MPGTFAVGGLVSGLDTQNILDQLREIERRPIKLLEERKSSYQKRLDAWKDINSKLQALKSAMDDLRQTLDFRVFSTSTEDKDYVTLTATSDASPGEHTIVISQLAQARRISSKSFSSKTDALQLSGDFLIDGHAISVSETDSLIDIMDKINNSNADVSASILQLSDTAYRLIISAKNTGEDSFHILDASTTNILQNLGIITGSVSIKNSVTGGAQSDAFSDISTTVGSVLGLNSPQSGTVTIGDKTVSINLASDSLADIRDKINTAAPTGVVAKMVTDTDDDGNTVYRLRIEGTTTFSDDNNVLQTLGILEGQTGFSGDAQVLTASRVNTTDGTTAITASTKFSEIYGASVASGDTIAIVGVDHSGNSVSSTFTITDPTTTTVQDLLTAIETAFSGSVSAAVNSQGKIVVTDGTTGSSQLDLTLIEHNEGGGSLDFGNFSVSTQGQDGISGDVQAGQDASVTVDGLQLTRSTNSINDILSGVTLNLHQADNTKTLNISVNRDLDAIVDKVNTFISKYNEIINDINQNFSYNQDTEKAGTLFGDSTLVSVQTEIRNIVSNRITGLPESLRSLAQVGIDSDRNGNLSLNRDKLLKKLQEDFDGVVKVFAAVGTTTDSDISYVSHTEDTKAGTYAVQITQAATQASVTGTTSLYSGIAGDEVITITDTNTNYSASISLNAGDDIDTIVSRINTELGKEYQQKRTSTGQILTGGNAATAFTAWTSVDGNVQVGDTFSISGTTHDGESVSGTYTVASGDTVQDLLSAIQTIFVSTVTATIDSSGHIVVTDVDSGSSRMDITITANNEGGGTLDLGTMDLTQAGRYSIPVTASNENGYLKLSHNDYGSANGFSVSQSANYLGITDGSFTGQDVAGTINGEEATGNGQNLVGNSDQPNIAGLVIRVTLTPDQLTSQGSDQGSITLTMGIAEQMYNHITTITDQFSGYVAQRQDAMQDIIDDIDDRIKQMETRVDKKISNLEMQFLNMEKSLSQLRGLSSFLTSQLNGLGGG